MDELPNPIPRKPFNVTYLIIIILLVIGNIWFYFRIQELEKSVTILQNQNETTQKNVKRIDSDIDTIYTAVNRIGSDVDRIFSSVNWNSSRLDYVIPLAENANKWAHRHGW